MTENKTTQMSMLAIFSQGELFGLEFYPAFELSNEFDKDKYVVVTMPISSKNIIIKYYIEDAMITNEQLESQEFIDSLLGLFKEYYMITTHKPNTPYLTN